MKMKAILHNAPAEAKDLYIGEWPAPKISSTELLIKVAATALNRADILQRQGKYPPPEGESPILGLEMAGEVVAAGDEVTMFKVGDQVCGLLGGGGYAEYVCIPESLAFPIPSGIDVVTAAAIPEAFLTAFQSLCWLANLQAGEKVLIHAGASGVGAAAIQLAKYIGASTVFATASAAKHQFCKDLGADHTIDYKTEDYQAVITEKTEGKGVDVIIDFIGATNFSPNLSTLAPDGRMVMLAFLGGIKVDEVNLLPILRKRLKIMGSTLRARSLVYKSQLIKECYEKCWNGFETGTLKATIDKTFPWTDAAAAHEYMEQNKNKGKIVLTVKQLQYY